MLKKRNTLKIGILLITITLLLVNCREDDTLSLQENESQLENKLIGKTLNASEIPEVINFITNTVSKDLKISIDDSQRQDIIHTKNIENDIVVGEIRTDNVKAVTDNSQKTNYSFEIIKENPIARYFINLIVRETNDGNFAYIVKYEFSDDWEFDGTNITTFKGKKIFYSPTGEYIAKFDISNDIATNILYRTPCPDENDTGSGSTGSTTNDNIDTGSDEGGFVDIDNGSETNGGGGTTTTTPDNDCLPGREEGKLYLEWVEVENTGTGDVTMVHITTDCRGNQVYSKSNSYHIINTLLKMGGGLNIDTNGDCIPDNQDDGYVDDVVIEDENDVEPINVNLSLIVQLFSLTGTTFTMEQNLWISDPDNLHFVNDLIEFLENNPNSQGVIQEVTMTIELKSNSHDWNFNQTGTFRNRIALNYIATAVPSNNSGLYYLLENGRILYDSPTRRVVNQEDIGEILSIEIDDYYYIYDQGLGRWFEYVLPSTNYNCLSCDLETIFLAALENGGVLLGRYILPVEDVLIVITGNDFYGVSQSRAVAGLFLLIDLVPGSTLVKGLKFVKYGDEIIDVSLAVIRYADDVFKSQKQTIKNVLENIINLDEFGNTIRKGNFGEMVTDTDLYSKGYEPIHIRRTNIDQPLDTGIDGVFKNTETGEYIIVESKYNTSQLGNTVDGRQMSQDWIEGSNRLLDVVGEEIYEEMIANGYTSVLSKILTDGTIVYKELDPFGYILNGWTP